MFNLKKRKPRLGKPDDLAKVTQLHQCVNSNICGSKVMVFHPKHGRQMFLSTTTNGRQMFLSLSGLCCCMQAYSSCGEQGLLYIAVHRLFIAVASLVSELGLLARGLQ